MLVSAAEASMRAYSPTLSYSKAQGCITSTLTNGGNLDVAAAFDACGLGQVVSEGMAAYRAANPAPTQPSSTGPPAATLFPAKPARQPEPRITKLTFKHHVLRITVAGIPKGLRLQLVVQERGKLGRLVTLAQTTTGRQDEHAARGAVGSDHGEVHRRRRYQAPGGDRDARRVRQARRRRKRSMR